MPTRGPRPLQRSTRIVSQGTAQPCGRLVVVEPRGIEKEERYGERATLNSHLLHSPNQGRSGHTSLTVPPDSARSSRPEEALTPHPATSLSGRSVPASVEEALSPPGDFHCDAARESTPRHLADGTGRIESIGRSRRGHDG